MSSCSEVTRGGSTRDAATSRTSCLSTWSHTGGSDLRARLNATQEPAKPMMLATPPRAASAVSARASNIRSSARLSVE